MEAGIAGAFLRGAIRFENPPFGEWTIFPAKRRIPAFPDCAFLHKNRLPPAYYLRKAVENLSEKWKKTLIGIVTGFANGLFGSGGGTIVVPAMERFLHVEEHKAHATAIAIILPLSVLSLIIYLWKTDVAAVWQLALWASAGGLAGGLVGAKLLAKVSGLWLHRIFGAFMLAAAVRMML